MKDDDVVVRHWHILVGVGRVGLCCLGMGVPWKAGVIDGVSLVSTGEISSNEVLNSLSDVVLIISTATCRVRLTGALGVGGQWWYRQVAVGRNEYGFVAYA